MATSNMMASSRRTERVVIKGSINDETIGRLDALLGNSCKGVQIVFADAYIVPKNMIEWLFKNVYNSTTCLIELYAVHPKLGSYFNSLNFQCKIIQVESNIVEPLKVIVIGGSSGSISVIENLAHLFQSQAVTLFVVQHISDDSQLLFDGLLRRYTKFSVTYPKSGEVIAPKTLYIAPPGVHMQVFNGKILLNDKEKINYARPSVSVLFNSIALEYKNAALAIVSCGYGKDGSEVLDVLKEHDTTVIIHSPKECEASSMPQSAIATGHFNHVLPLQKIETLLAFLLSEGLTPEEELLLFLEQLYHIYGYNFGLYDSKSMSRRIEEEMRRLFLEDFKLYYKKVLTEKEAFHDLLFAVSINVTQFFRKPLGWNAFKRVVQDELSAKQHLKIWVAGCSSGEESYTIGMILGDLELLERAIIYSTDFNWIVLQEAINAVYPTKEVNNSKMNANSVLQTKSFHDFFETNEAYCSIAASVKKRIVFFEHNLMTDGSFNEFSFISCKNVIIYFNETLRLKTLQLFYNSLERGGFLQLGSSESMPFEFRDRFAAYNLEHKIYRKIE